MTLRPGANLVRGLVLILLFAPLTFLWWQIAVALAGSFVLLAAAAERERRHLARAFEVISVSRSLPKVVGRDRPFDVRLTVTNGNPFDLRCELRDEHPAATVPRVVLYSVTLPARDSAAVSTTCNIPRRGRHAFGPVWIRLQGPARVVEAQRPFACPAFVKVLPETFASRDELQKDVGAEIRLLDQQRRSRQAGAGTEFESLHHFRYGDDPRRIDWRATARQQALVVRRFQVERHRDVMIIVDSGRLMGTDVGRGTKLDCAVDAALNLARVALQSGDRCGVAAYDHRVRGFLPPIAGIAALGSILQCVYDLETQWHESDFTPMLAELRSRQAKRTFIIVISDLSDSETSRRLCA